MTAVSGFNGTGTVTLAAGSYIDAAGNAGGPNSDTVPIDMRTNDPNDFDDQATGTSITTVGLVIHGTANDDNPINAFNSGQTIYGGASNDTINGDNSGDILFGGSGDAITYSETTAVIQFTAARERIQSMQVLLSTS